MRRAMPTDGPQALFSACQLTWSIVSNIVRLAD
jgi:hypothetical protein